MRCIALSFLLALVLAGCGNEPPRFYDYGAKALAKRAVQQRKFADPSEVVASVKERHDCPQAPSSDAGPCLDVVLESEVTAQPVPGTHSSAAGAKIQTSVDVFVWLTKTGKRWKVTYMTLRPRSVAVDGVPYSPSN